MKRPAKPIVNLDSLTGEVANLRAVAGDEMMQAAFAIVRERLDLTPEKLALLLLRILNPDEIVQQGEEATLRGVRHETLKGYKDGKLLPALVNGK